MKIRTTLDNYLRLTVSLLRREIVADHRSSCRAGVARSGTRGRSMLRGSNGGARLAGLKPGHYNREATARPGARCARGALQFVGDVADWGGL
jgi:hypothetical protein